MHHLSVVVFLCAWFLCAFLWPIRRGPTSRGHLPYKTSQTIRMSLYACCYQIAAYGTCVLSRLRAFALPGRPTLLICNCTGMLHASLVCILFRVPTKGRGWLRALALQGHSPLQYAPQYISDVIPKCIFMYFPHQRAQRPRAFALQSRFPRPYVSIYILGGFIQIYIICFVCVVYLDIS